MLQFQLPPPDVTWGVGPGINKFEQVSTDHHQMSLAREGMSLHLMPKGKATGKAAGDWSPGLMSGGTLPCDLSHDIT